MALGNAGDTQSVSYITLAVAVQDNHFELVQLHVCQLNNSSSPPFNSPEFEQTKLDTRTQTAT